MADDRIMAGLAMRLLAILLLSSMTALVKLAGQHGASLIESMFFRQLCALPLVVGWIAAGPGLASIRTHRIGAHLTRAAIGTTGMIFTFGAVLLLPLAEATTLSFTVPIFATVLGAVLLKEPTGWHRWGAVLVGFLGVLIVAQPSGGHFPLEGTIIGLLAALFVAIVAITLRQLGKTESSGTTVFWFTTLSLPPLALIYLFFAHPHDGMTWLILIATGLVGGAGQLALTASVRFAPVSVVVPMDYSGLIWATLYGWFFFAMLPTPYTWVGAPVIIGSGLYIVWREHKRGTPESPVSAAETPA